MNKKGMDKVSCKLAATLFEHFRTNDAANLELVEICLQKAATLVRSNAELKSCLLNPSVSKSDKIALLVEVSRQDANTGSLAQSEQETISNFFALVLEYNAILWLHKISAHFTRLVDALKKLASIQVDSAFEYSAEDRAQLEQKLAQDLGLTPKITWTTDKDLIGGAVVKLHDQILDSPVRGALNNLKEALL